MRVPAIIIIGPPGAGKGTHATSLSQDYDNVHHISTGDAFRAQKDSPLAKKYARTLASGAFFPDEVAMQLIGQEIERRGYTHSDLVIVDGAPRTVEQVHLLDTIVDVRHVLALDTDNDKLLEDRLRQRNQRPYDRDPEATKRRFAEYRTLTRPVLKLYEQTNRTVTYIDPTRERVVVHSDIEQTVRNNPSLVHWF